MSSKKIVHIATASPIIPPFIEFVQEHFDFKKHAFYIIGDTWRYPFKRHANTSFSENRKRIDFIWKNLRILTAALTAEKIIFHGLFSRVTVLLFFLFPWLLKKSYWAMWGGDFYFPEKQSWFKKQVIKRMGYLISYIKGDYDLVQKWYGARGKYHECILYPSNLYKEYDVFQKESLTLNIQVGNSADPTNNHLEIFEKLIDYKDRDIKIFVPLSYGNKLYAKNIIKVGEELFGKKFVPLTDMMPFDQYLSFLGKINIAIFNHNRQQAMGNIITILGLGKEVYIRSDITPWKMFKNMGVKIYDVADLDLNCIDKKSIHHNIDLIKQYFSSRNLITQLKTIFEE